MMNSQADQGHQSHELMTSWANSIIESAKVLVLNGNSCPFQIRGLPWYKNGDCWIEDSWWVAVAERTYQKYYNTDIWIAEELQVLVDHYPEQYTEYVRSRIDLWYSLNYTHDCESWTDLAMRIYPEHEIFQELYDNISGYSYSEKIMLANLGYKNVANQIRNELLGYFDEQDSFWLNHRLSGLVACGGKKLVQAVFLEDDLQLFRNWIRSIAQEEYFPVNDGSSEEKDYSIGQSVSIRTAVLMDWQDIIDALAQNSSCLNSLDAFGILWWSLTDKKELVQDFILKYSHRPNILSHIDSETMALAVAWKRSMT